MCKNKTPTFDFNTYPNSALRMNQSYVEIKNNDTSYENIHSLQNQSINSQSEVKLLNDHITNLEIKVNSLLDNHNKDSTYKNDMTTQNDFLRNKLDAFSNNFNRVQTEFERCKKEYNNKSE